MKYFCVIDFECTCDADRTNPPEIIEFPAVFINPVSYSTDFIFREFVRPTENPVLFDYCTDLTGITQDQVDQAFPLSEVLLAFSEFVNSNDIEFQLVTDGPWDVVKFLVPECRRKEIPLPRWCLSWLDLGQIFKNKFRLDTRRPLGMMLSMCGLELEGRHHSGIDDAKNISQLLVHFAKRGSKVNKPNKHLPTLAQDVFQ